MNINEWVEQLIATKKRVSIPIMTHPGIEILGKTVKNAVQDGEVHANAVLELTKIFPSIAVTTIMDLTLEAEAFGCHIDFPENDMPHILSTIINNSNEIEKLEVPDLTVGRIPQYLKANKLIVESVVDRPVFGGVIGPFSLAGRLFGMSEIMLACYIEPKAIAALLNKCIDFIISYCQELKKIGCSGVIVAEPAAGLLSNEDCNQFSSAYIKRLVSELQDDSFMIILHNCGNKGHCTEAMLNTDAASLHFGNAIDMVDALIKCPKDKLVMGNIDPVGIIKQCTPEEVKAFTMELLIKTAEFDNFILSTGCDLPPHVPIENIMAFYSALNEFNERKR